MYLKLALRNIRRSVRDYAVYFITLLFGVAVFYAFNSIGSQQILFDMETSASRSVFDSTTYILGMFSVVVAACWASSFCTPTSSSSAAASGSSAPTWCWA